MFVTILHVTIDEVHHLHQESKAYRIITQDEHVHIYGILAYHYKDVFVQYGVMNETAKLCNVHLSTTSQLCSVFEADIVNNSFLPLSVVQPCTSKRGRLPFCETGIALVDLVALVEATSLVSNYLQVTLHFSFAILCQIYI